MNEQGQIRDLVNMLTGNFQIVNRSGIREKLNRRNRDRSVSRLKLSAPVYLDSISDTFDDLQKSDCMTGIASKYVGEMST